jgi:hypothetical protein
MCSARGFPAVGRWWASLLRALLLSPEPLGQTVATGPFHFSKNVF